MGPGLFEENAFLRTAGVTEKIPPWCFFSVSCSANSFNRSSGQGIRAASCKTMASKKRRVVIPKGLATRPFNVKIESVEDNLIMQNQCIAKERNGQLVLGERPLPD